MTDLHHLCENKLCVNPDHLQEIPRSDHLRLRGKLTYEEAQEIRADPRSGPKVAAYYGVSRQTISDVRRGLLRNTPPPARNESSSMRGHDAR
jgi:hypothetical protein